MATVEEMKSLGYTAKQSPLMQLSNIIQGTQDYTQKQDQQKAADEQDQTKLYFALRQQGYSDVDAADRVNRTYRSTNFLQKVLTGQDNVFTVGSEPDQMKREQAKAKSEATAKQAAAEKAQAEAYKAAAQGDYYAAGGPAQRYQHNDNLTPNQIQQRIKYLEGQKGMGKPEDDAAIAEEQAYLGDLFNKKSGYKQDAQVPSAAKDGKIKVKRKSDGATGTMSASAFDPSKYDKV